MYQSVKRILLVFVALSKWWSLFAGFWFDVGLLKIGMCFEMN